MLAYQCLGNQQHFWQVTAHRACRNFLLSLPTWPQGQIKITPQLSSEGHDSHQCGLFYSHRTSGSSLINWLEPS